MSENNTKNRIEKRNWLLTNFDYVIEHVIYYRMHTDDLKLEPKQTLWQWDTENGSAYVD